MRSYFVKYLHPNILLISQIDVFTKPVMKKAGKASTTKEEPDKSTFFPNWVDVLLSGFDCAIQMRMHYRTSFSSNANRIDHSMNRRVCQILSSELSLPKMDVSLLSTNTLPHYELHKERSEMI
jgi:hypothetical protein